jgi:type II secretory pathway component GspD/PulD (secretin)
MFILRFIIFCIIFGGMTIPLCAQYPQTSYPSYPYPTQPQRQLYAPDNVTPPRVFLTAQTDGGQPNVNQPIQFEAVQPNQQNARIQFVPNTQVPQYNQRYLIAQNPPALQPNIPAPPLRQLPPPQNIPQQKNVDEELVQLNFPNEVDLEVLVEYISQRLQLKILFDEAIANKKIRLRTTGDIPVDSLMQVLQSALKMKELTIVDADVPGWKRIIPVAQLGTLAPQGNAQQILKEHGGATPVMQIFTLEHADVTQVQQLIQPFLTPQGSLCTPVKESNTLIVSDYAVNVIKVTELIKTLDVPKPTIKTEFLEVKNIDAAALSRQITAILQARSQVSGTAATAIKINITSDPRTNQLILTGLAEDIVATKQLIESLDVPSNQTTELYTFQYIDARDIDTLVKSMLDPLQEKIAYRSIVNRNDNSLVVSTTKEIHQQIVEIAKRMNIPATQKQSPIQFYKLNNTTVDEVMTTLTALRQGTGFNTQTRDRDTLRKTLPGSQGSFNHIGGAVTFPLKPDEPLPQLTPDVPAEGTALSTTTSAISASTTSESQTNTSLPEGVPVSMLSALLDTDVRITADTKTNTIIVVAEPQIQEHYATLIKFLDRRSPQVLIEAKIVTLDTSNDFMLGVEISGGDRKGEKRLFGFSSFGLSTPDPVSGALALLPGLGFNGTLVDPDMADVIVRALSSNSRAKVVASPRLLINDNEEGRLQSVQSIPYTSVNSSQVVQSTSLGGNQDAGTTIVVTPHIGDSEQLQLEFAVEFSNFGTSSTNANLPPPRHVDQVSSVVTIPDGYTVIVGGLNRRDIEAGRTGLPFLDKIPILKYLASTENDNKKNTSLFVFLKPIILRDDKFKDLKYLSDQDARSAQIRTTLPQSRPLVME